ncbi:MAG: hypothetical protein IKI49_01030 [Oscillospiraceae bacterium]|nr:hypothetical protein [Oscillospiraceae bacterium]
MVRTLLKARIAATLSNIGKSSKKAGAKKRGVGFKILMGFLIVYILGALIIMFGAIFFATALTFSEADLDWLYYAMAGIFAFAFCFIGSVFMSQHQIFEAKDNEMLLAMPIKPSAILASRVIAIYVFNLAYTLVVMLPAVVIRAILFGTSVLELVFVLICVLLIPVMSMALSCVLGWLLALISSKMRNKNAITLILYVVFMGAYFYVCFNAGNYIMKLTESGTALADTVRRVLFPAYHMGLASAYGNFGSLLIFIACAAVPFAIVFFVISRNYISIMSAKTGTRRVKYVEKRLRESGAMSSLIGKEMKRFTGSAMYMLNGGMGTLMSLIVVAGLIIRKEFILNVAGMYGLSGISVPAIICMLMCVLSSMNIISASSVSLEGKTMWLMKSLPVNASDVLIAKAMCHFIVTAGGAVIAGAVACVVIKATAVEAAAMALVLIAFSAFAALADIMVNLHMPKFDWINEVACVKQSGSVTVSMLMNLAIAIAPIILYFVLFSRFMGATAFLFSAAAFFAVVAAVLFIRLKTAGVRMFNELQA